MMALPQYGTHRQGVRVMLHTAAPRGWNADPAEADDEELTTREPTPGERARTVLGNSRSGVLGAVVGEPPAPMGFAVPYALDDDGYPLVSLRPGIERCIRIRDGIQVSFTVAETPLTASNSGTPGGVSVFATVSILGPGPELQKAVAMFMRSQPAETSAIKRNASKLLRLDPSAMLVASGTGDVQRVDFDEYVNASSDPLAAVAPGLVSHLGANENGSLVLLCRAYGGLHDTKSAELVGLDQYGMDLLAVSGSGRRPVRIAFSQSVSSPDDVRRELVAMTRGARFKLGAG